MTIPYNKIYYEALKRLRAKYPREFDAILLDLKMDASWHREKKSIDNTNVGYVAKKALKEKYKDRYIQILEEEKQKYEGHSTPYNRACMRLIGEHYNEYRALYKKCIASHKNKVES